VAVGGCAVGVTVGSAACVSATVVSTKDTAVSKATVGCVRGEAMRLLHEVNITATKNKRTVVLLMIFTFSLPFMFRSNYISCRSISSIPDAIIANSPAFFILSVMWGFEELQST
jgi:hypothetical protein